MFTSVKREIPEFLRDEIVYCDTLTNDQKQRSCLILLRNLMFYEFRQKTVIKSLDLRMTCLNKIHQQLQNYTGRRGKWYDMATVDSPVDEITSHLVESEITFGKYIYRNFEIKKLFLLIKCWDKLIVLRSSENEDKNLVLVDEYEEVSTYKLVHGRIKFHVCVEIKYTNGTIFRTDFQKDEVNLSSAENTQEAPKHSNFKLLLERIRSAKTELFVHKSITEREYVRLKATQTFGCNFLRSEQIEEKQLLAKCGDVWMRLADEYVIIGVPLVNNASLEDCIVLTNLRPIFDSNGKPTFNYSFRLYQLYQCFVNMESVETFFQTENETKHKDIANIWNTAEETKLLPEAFGVLCIKLHFSEAVTLQGAPLFIFFDIERDVSNIRKETMVFNQQVFIKNIPFNILLSNRVQYEIKFEQSTVHQDFLAIAMSSVETKVAIVFKDVADLEKFEELLMQRFDLEKIVRYVGEMDNQKQFPHFLYRNQKQCSTWYGTLFLRCAGENYNRNGLKIKWKLYVKTEEKTYTLLKMILNELVLLKCNIAEINFFYNDINDQIVKFEDALRKELSYALLSCNEEVDGKAPSKLEEKRSFKLEQMLKLEMQTDLLANCCTKE